MKLTDLSIKAIKPPESFTTYWDTALPGFGVRCSPKGKKTFTVMYGESRQRVTIGVYPLMTLSDARNSAKHHLYTKDTATGQICLNDARVNFLSECKNRLRPSTVKQYTQHLNQLSKEKLTDIKRNDIDINNPYAVASWKAFFNWAIQNEMIDRNPFQFIKAKTNKRERVLLDEEIRAIWAYDYPPYSNIVKLLFLTGLRRTEVMHLQLDGDIFTLPPQHTKNGRGHTLPDELRTSHQHIVAGSGSGKTQALQQLILNDLKDDVAIVVIDSQGDFINKLATRIDPERLILIDPEHCAPALNLFAKQESEKQVATAIELYEYIFSSLDAEMTSKQQTAYRFVSRLLMTVPKANIHTMREVLEPKGSFKYQKYIDELGETAKSFFLNEFESKQFAETKQQILRRLYSVLENKTLEQMLGATESRLNIGEALDSGKVVLISTAKSYLKQTGASLLGRIFIAQVMQSVMAREANRKRTYLYIDEFQDYAEDSHVLFNLFEQARKYNLGLIIAHQYLGQLPLKLRQSISANTAIKFAKNPSVEDTSILAKQMFTTPEFIQNQGKGDFACYLKGQEVSSYHVEFGKLERTTELSNLSSIRDNMRARYGVPSPTEPIPPKEPYIEPRKGQGSGEVVEEKEEENPDRSKW